ncbi:hypothetical protein C1645_732342 [Glomus cerebriforme]|uniref:Uncharacterized protein n=1 Tax=Glomus cerebriforme TaxID=658196 RepID=A0A397TRG6_9GLOM|nr:hypothetical protein C1645_732342 [Glomus cerebriforme]
MGKEKKEKYKIGVYFGCQKCLYCGINLEKDIQGTETMKVTDIAKIIDLEATSSEVSTTIIQSESKCNNSETENESNAELKLEVNYKFVIKQADGTILPAKNYSVTIFELDEFLLAIQNNITALLEDKEINANDYI